jgi:hypothetical protein
MVRRADFEALFVEGQPREPPALRMSRAAALTPAEYRDRPRPRRSLRRPPGRGRVKELAERHARGERLWRPSDAVADLS